jgi:hypothetical protein
VAEVGHEKDLEALELAFIVSHVRDSTIRSSGFDAS